MVWKPINHSKRYNDNLNYTNMKKQQFELFGLTFDIKNINQNKVITHDNGIIYTL